MWPCSQTGYRKAKCVECRAKKLASGVRVIVGEVWDIVKIFAPFCKAKGTINYHIHRKIQ